MKKINKTIEKIIVCGEIQNTRPLIIGSGSKDYADIDILLDHEETPFIPASSFLGVLGHALKKNIDEKDFNNFWGYSKGKESWQSCIRCSDLFPTSKDNIEIAIRDGVEINSAEGQAKDQGKYNFQILEPGVSFSIRIEINVKENPKKQKDLCRKIALNLKNLLESGNFSVGAKTFNGFGQLRAHNLKILLYDFSKEKNAMLKWLTNQDTEDASSKLKQNYPDLRDYFNPGINFCLNAKFKLKTSLLIDSGFSDKFNSTHIMSGDKPVLPGTSVKGVVRARAEKIINTLSQKNNSCNSEFFKDLFGYVDKSKKTAKRSRIIIGEKYLPNFETFEQYRIRVDRFTGGAINGALFSALPLGSFKDNTDPKENYIELTLEIKNCKDYEAGLILLVLKDLWTGDCTLGGGKAIGRGVLKGVEADIDFDKDTFSIKDEFGNFDFTETNEKLKTKDDVQEWITTLYEEISTEPVTEGKV